MKKVYVVFPFNRGLFGKNTLNNESTEKYYYTSLELLKRGYKVTWLVHTHTSGSIDAEDDGIEVVQSKSYHIPWPLSLAYFYLYSIYFLIIKQIKIVYINCWFSRNSFFLFLSFLCLKILKIHIIYDVGDPLVDYEIANQNIKEGTLKEKILRSLSILAYNLADLLLVNSEILKENLFSKGVAKEKICVAYWGYDEKKFNIDVSSDKKINLIKDSLNLNESFIIGWFGSMSKFKGIQEIIIPIIKSIKSTVPDAFFIIGGGGALEYLFVQLKNNAPDAPFLYLGWIPYEVVPYYMATCDLIIVPLNETYDQSKYALSLKITHSIALGTPVVTVKSPANLFHFREFSNIYFVDATPNAFTNAIFNIKNKYKTQSPNVDTTLIEEFSLQKTAVKIAEEIEKKTTI